MEITLNLQVPHKDVELRVADLERTSEDNESVPFDISVQASVFHGSRISFSWRLSENTQHIDLTPLELDATRLNGTGVRICLHSPCRILQGCVSVSESGSDIVVDFITTSNHLCTFAMPQQWLLAANPQEIDASPELRVCQPYNFSLVAPRMLTAVSTKQLIVALASGKLVRFDRSSSAVEPVHTEFQDPFFLGHSSGLFGLFKPQSDKVPGDPNLSVHSCVAIEAVGSNHLVTFSVDSALRLWSLDSNTCLQRVPHVAHDTPLRTLPTCFLASAGAGQFVAAFESELGLYTITSAEHLVLKRSTPVPQEVRSWFISGLCVVENGEMLVAYKMNAAVKFFWVRNQEWIHAGGYDYEHLLEIPTNTSIEQTQQRLAEIPEPLVRIALHHLLSVSQSPLTSELLRRSEPVDTLVIGSALESLGDETDLRTQWLRLDAVCRDLEAQSAELLGVAPAISTRSGMFFWTLRAHGVSILSFKTTEVTEPQHSDVLTLMEPLLSGIPLTTMKEIAAQLLSSQLVTERINNVCALLRPHLDQTKLNDVGRTTKIEVASAIRQYIESHSPSNRITTTTNSTTTTNTTTELSATGIDAVQLLVYDYASTESKSFLNVCSLCIIALVEGWLTDGDATELLRTAISALRRLTFIARLGSNNLQLKITAIDLANFGFDLAKKITGQLDELTLLGNLLPPSSIKADFGRMDAAVRVLEPSSEATLVQSLAALAACDESNGASLAQKVSLARPWLSTLEGERPVTQAAWFYRVARYAGQLNAKDAAVWLAKYGESLSPPNSNDSQQLLRYVLELSMASQDVSSAYTALVRLFPQPDPEDSEVSGYVHDLILTAATVSAEEARALVMNFPFVGFSTIVERVLTTTVTFGSVPAYRLRYAFNTQRENYVGAAQAIYEHIKSEESIEPTRRAELYSYCLDSLSQVEKDSRWFAHGTQCVTFADVTAELDHLRGLMAI